MRGNFQSHTCNAKLLAQHGAVVGAVDDSDQEADVKQGQRRVRHDNGRLALYSRHSNFVSVPQQHIKSSLSIESSNPGRPNSASDVEVNLEYASRVDVQGSVTFWQLRPRGWARRLSMVLVMLVLMHAMQQAPVAVVRKFVREGGLVEGPAGAQHDLCVGCSEVEVGREDEEHKVDGCMEQQGALECALHVVPTPQEGGVVRQESQNSGDENLSKRVTKSKATD